jgi:hypothetical protein
MAGRFRLFSRLRLFGQSTRVPEARARRYTLTNPFHAVSVQPASRCCEQARSCAGKRFLSAEAPQLPLPNCDAVHCNCRYQHHEDRRAGTRRESDLLHRQNHFWSGRERRRDSGRRITDL